MSFLYQIISEQIISAIGWTLFHSLWQGAAIALLFVLIIVFTRRYRPQMRYLIGVVAMFLMVTVSIVTFFTILNSDTQSSNNINHIAQIFTTPDIAAGETISYKNESKNTLLNSLASFFKDYFKEHLPLIVTIWLLGIFLYVLRFTGGFIYKKRFKTWGVKEPSEFWKKQFTSLCKMVGVTKSIRLMESSMVKVPILMGHLKPVILFPASLLSRLPQDQVEALLVHEVAHILRKDYLINIVQHIIDILYFYHPGIRWISSMVRYERENCCDDIAISVSGNTVNFARALTNIYSFNQRFHGTIMAITGKRNRLLNRVKRILTRSKSGSKFTEGFIAASILSIFILTVTATANWSLNNENKMTPHHNTANFNSEKMISKIYILKENYQVEINGKTERGGQSIQRVKIVDYNTGKPVWNLKNKLLKKETKGYSFKDTIYLKKGCYEINVLETLTLSINPTNKGDKTKPILINVDDWEIISGRLIPTSELKLAKRIEQEQLALQKAIPIRKKLEEMHLKRAIPVEDELARKREEEHRLQREVIERQRQQEEIQRKLQAQLTQLQKTQEEERQRRHELETLMRETELRRQLEEEERHKEELVRRRLEEMTKYKELKLREEIERQKQEISSQRELGLQLEELKKHEAEITLRLEEEKRRLGLLEQRLEKELAVVTSIKKELLNDNLIKKEEEFEFKISLKGMFIDGIKQSEKTFIKYRKLYESKSGENLKRDAYVKIIDKID